MTSTSSSTGTSSNAAAPLDELTETERTSLLRRTLAVLAAGVVPAGAALSGTFAATALLAKEITGNGTLAGLAAASVTGGTALAAIPMAQLMAKHGRRVGMVTAYVGGGIGASLAFVAAIYSFYPFLVLGAAMIGAANSGTLAARFAAADVASEDTRARSIGLLVWLGMFGSVAGPILSLDVAAEIADSNGLPRLSGPYLLVIGLFALAGAIIFGLLRPDPLEMAGGVVRKPTTSGFAELRSSMSTLRANRLAFTAVGCLATAHAVMVGVMTMTSLHMEDGGHGLRIIGFVISFHIIGMYFFAPLIGWVVDRVDSALVLAAGGVVLLIGTQLAARNVGLARVDIFAGLFLIGLGWSFCLVASSAIVTAAVSGPERVKVQGLSDFTMTTAGVIAAIASGTIVELWSFATLAYTASVLALAVMAAGFTVRRSAPRVNETTGTA